MEDKEGRGHLILATHSYEQAFYAHVEKSQIFTPFFPHVSYHPRRQFAGRDRLVFYWASLLVGIGQVAYRPFHTAYLCTLAIDGPWQKRGLGRLLLQAIEEWVMERSVRTIVTDAFVQSARFYYRQGYLPMKSTSSFHPPTLSLKKACCLGLLNPPIA